MNFVHNYGEESKGYTPKVQRTKDGATIIKYEKEVEEAEKAKEPVFQMMALPPSKEAMNLNRPVYQKWKDQLTKERKALVKEVNKIM